MKQFKKCSILKEANSHYSNSSNKLRNILPFGEMDRTDGKYTHGKIMPMTEEDKARDREEIMEYMNNKEHIFSLICSCGHIMSGIITSTDIYDKLHCDCGLVWKVNKPNKGENKMKQNITISQLQELSQEQQIKLRDLWKPKQYDLVAYTYKYHEGLETDKVIIKLYNNDPTKVEEVSDMEGEYVFPKENCLPIFNIGQMFEMLLGCSCIDCTKRMLNENTHNKIYGIELCDALWKLIKEYL